MADNEKLVSEFNEMSYHISRLHNDWLETKSYREKGLFSKVRWKLDSIELELKYDAKKLDDSGGTDYVNQLSDVNKGIIIAIKTININEFYNKLMKKEELLREIQQECGKGSRYKNPSEDDLE